MTWKVDSIPPRLFHQLWYPEPIFFSHLQLREKSVNQSVTSLPRHVSTRHRGGCSQPAWGEHLDALQGQALPKERQSVGAGKGDPQTSCCLRGTRHLFQGPEGRERANVLRLWRLSLSILPHSWKECPTHRRTHKVLAGLRERKTASGEGSAPTSPCSTKVTSRTRPPGEPQACAGAWGAPGPSAGHIGRARFTLGLPCPAPRAQGEASTPSEMGTPFTRFQNECSPLGFSHCWFKWLQLSQPGGRGGGHADLDSTSGPNPSLSFPFCTVLLQPILPAAAESWLFREFKQFLLAFFNIIPRWDTTLLPSLAALSDSNILIFWASQEAPFLTKIFTLDMCNFQESKIWS